MAYKPKPKAKPNQTPLSFYHRRYYCGTLIILYSIYPDKFCYKAN